MGIIGNVIAGGVEGGALTGRKIGLDAIEAQIREDAAARLQENQARLQQETHAANAQTDIANIGPRGAAETGVAVERATALQPITLDTKTKELALEATARMDEFTKMEPLKRKAAIDTAVEQMKALSTPEMLKAARDQALAKHIADPHYVAVAGENGEVMMVDSKNPTKGVKLMDGDKPFIQRNAEQRQLAIAGLNFARSERMAADVVYGKDMAAAAGDPAKEAAAQKKLDAEVQRINVEIAAPALAVLNAKMGGAPKPAGAPAVPADNPKLDYGFVNPNTGAKYIGKPGDNIRDASKWDTSKDWRGSAPAAKATSTSESMETPRRTDDVLPHEKGGIIERAALGSVRPALAGTAATVDEVRAVIAKPNLNASDLLLIESFKDSKDLTAQERAKIALLLKRQ